MATMTSSGLLTTAAGATRAFVLPQRDPFVLWARQAAIFKQTKHPEAAKLYMNWVLSLENQVNMKEW
jgi:ABC-type Fe3+ transport system substrate-binding protein